MTIPPTGLHCGACNRYLPDQPRAEHVIRRERQADGTFRRVAQLVLRAHCSSCGARDRIERRVALPVVAS